MSSRASHVRRLALCFGVMLAASCGGGDGGVTPAGSTGGSENSGGSGGNSGSVTLTWVAPTEYTDGTMIYGLAGYHIYHGERADSLAQVRRVDGPGATTAVLEGLPRGTHYFAVSAFLNNGTEGDRSTAVSKSIR